ncbi:hypothetical protein ZPR_3951 [Zunongwangia profunda SM-A87]|uniref:Uncharacterized protein n=2 Tax=Zunongwangia profunda TaxID=398743 RepID=D5BMB5_ZUNPS|nr:hypothetical protein ZPR_3951 [Zunongwangia profunda SM-A87]
MEIMKGYNVDYLYHKDLNSEEYKMEKHIYKYFYILISLYFFRFVLPFLETFLPC